MASPDVFTGFWHNHSIPGAWGWTWTLNTSSANYLLVFLGIYLGFVGSSLWTIIAFLLHSWMAKQEPGDGIHHQILLILRNTSAPLGAASELVSVALSWRKVNSLRRVAQPLLLGLLPLVIAIGFIITGIESTKVSAGDDAANEVKIKPQNCGPLLWSSPSNPNTSEVVGSGMWQAQTSREARSYVQDCYGNSTRQISQSSCMKYPVDQIQYNLTLNAPCPFNESMCTTGTDHAAVTMDTHLFDSHQTLGINAAPSDRVFLRKLSTCTIIESYQYSNASIDPSTLRPTEYLWLGSRDYIVETVPYTYSYPITAATDGFGYQIETIIYRPGDSGSWTPIPGLQRDDADVSIFIVSANSVYYPEKVDDPLFAAHVNITSGFHRADQYYNVLGCADQYQICPTATYDTSCTPINSRDHVYTLSHHIGLNKAQVVAAELVMNISFFTDTSASVVGLGAAALLANDQLTANQISGALPDTQWQLEASNFFAISLARLQASVPVFTSKSSDFFPGQYAGTPTPDQQRYICNNQKIRNIGGYQSFTAAAVWIIIGVGLIILVLGSTIDSCFGFVQKRRQWKYYKVLQWKTDSKFQQQRIAMSSSGNGTWTSDEDIPLTLRGEILAVPKRGHGDMLVY